MIKQCVLIGKQGSGKTSFFNRICRKKEAVSSGLHSCTKLITSAQSKDAYTVVDTPGISFMKEVFENQIAIVAALTQGPIHKILLVVKYDYRIEELYKAVSDVIPLVKEYTQLLGVVVTHMDLCSQDKLNSFRREAQEMLFKYFKINFVTYTAKGDNGYSQSLDIQRSLFQSGLMVKITDNKFDDLMLQFEFNTKLEQGKNELIYELQIFNNTVRHFLQDFKPQKNQDQILNSLLVFVRKEQNRFLQQFEKKYGPIMEEIHQKSDNPLQAYYFHYVIKFYVKKEIQQLINIINKNMIYPEDHPFRLLRRCPYCSTIWFKAIGCDNDTSCGKKLSEQDEIKIILNKKALYNEYEFYYENQQQLNFRLLNKNLDQEEQYYQQQIKNLSKNSLIGYKYSSLLSSKFFQDLDETDILSKQGSFRSITIDDLYQVKQKAQTISPFGKKMINQVLLDQQQAQQIAKHQRVGCGQEFIWQDAPLVNFEELDLNQEQILAIFSDKDSLYQEEFQNFKQDQIKKELRKQRHV